MAHVASTCLQNRPGAQRVNKPEISWKIFYLQQNSYLIIFIKYGSISQNFFIVHTLTKTLFKHKTSLLKPVTLRSAIQNLQYKQRISKLSLTKAAKTSEHRLIGP